MAEKRRNYGDECKRETVRLGAEYGDGVSETARNLGVNPNMLGVGNVRWKRNKTRHVPVTVEKEALHWLRDENKRLCLERDILKKSPALLCPRVEL